MKSWLIAPLSGLVLATTPAFANAASISSPISEVAFPTLTDLAPPVKTLPPVTLPVTVAKPAVTILLPVMLPDELTTPVT